MLTVFYTNMLVFGLSSSCWSCVVLRIFKIFVYYTNHVFQFFDQNLDFIVSKDPDVSNVFLTSKENTKVGLPAGYSSSSYSLSEMR